MSTPLVVNGVTYQYPQQGDKNWGPTLNTWSQAVTLGMLQKAGGSFPLTAETDFGASFGLKVLSLKSQEANIATTGILRLGNASAGLVWRNAANNADLALTVNASNQLTFNGTSIGATTSLTNGHILVGNVSNQPADVALSGDATITNAGVLTIANGAITTAKLSTPVAIAAGGTNSTTALVNGRLMVSDAGVIKEASAITASMAIVTDTGGFPTTGGATATEISRLSGLSSNAQTQLTARLQLAGGTMSGAINMGSNKITALTQGAATGEAATFDQLQQFVPTGVMLPYGGASAPTGWILCNGAAVSRTTFSALFAVVGTAFGVGDGSTTFNVPNLVNNVPVGSGGSIVASRGSTAGGVNSTSVAITGSLDLSSITAFTPAGTQSTVYGPLGNGEMIAATSNSGGGSYRKLASSVTANGTVNVVQPSLGVNYIIKT